MTWLSILVPVYNVRPYLEECLTSIFEQADPDVQVLALDDCSTDGSWELMQKLALRWPGRLQLLQHQRNAGLSAARNSMIEAATGEYLWFLDSDDKLQPGSLDTLANIVQTHAPDVVLCDFSVWREKQRLKHQLRGEAHRRSFNGPSGKLLYDRSLLLSGLFATGQMHAWSKISKRHFWDSTLRFPAGRYFEDLMCMPLLALRCRSFYYCAQPWVAYRQRATSILSTMNTAKAQDQSAALLGFTKALRNDPLGQDPCVKLGVAQQCARNFIGAMRFIKRQKHSLSTEKTSDLIQQFRNDFTQALPYSVTELLRIYLSRGWWLRAIKLYTWLRYSG